MAQTKIRGITIQIDADTNPLMQKFKETSASLKDTERYLKDINSLLKFNPKDVNLLVEKQQALTHAVAESGMKLATLKGLYEDLPKGQNGQLTQEQKKLKEEIALTEGVVKKYEKQLKDTNEQIIYLSGGTEDVGKKTHKTKNEILDFADVLKANLNAEMIKGFANAMLNVGKEIFNAGVETRAYADDVLALATTYGMTTDQIQEFKYMSELTDTSLETITGSITKLTRNMQSATKGTGDAYNRFRQLGIDVTNSDGTMRSANEVFAEAIDKLGKMENQTERDALSMNIFGRSAIELNPIIEAGSERIQQYTDEAHQMGYVLDSETLESLGAVDDSMQRASRRIETVKNQIGRYLAPVVAEITEAFAEWRMSVDWQQVGSIITTVVDAIGWAIKGLIKIFETVIDVGIKVAKTLKDIFTGNFKFPKIALPHFAISPRGWSVGDLLLGKIPKLSIDWYRKAMDKGMVLDGATIFGMNANGQLMGGGEKGREVIIGENALMRQIRNASGNSWNVSIVVNESVNAERTADAVLNKLQMNVSSLERRWR